MTWYDMIWYDMIWYDMIWYDMVWYDMIWYDMIWYDMIWFDMILENFIIWYHMISYDVIWYRNHMTLSYDMILENLPRTHRQTDREFKTWGHSNPRGSSGSAGQHSKFELYSIYMTECWILRVVFMWFLLW